MRYPLVLFDVGGTLIRARDGFGATYVEAYRGVGIDVDPTAIEQAIRQVWAETERRWPAGTDRFSVYPGGEVEYWLRFSIAAVERATGSAPDRRQARAALEHIRDVFLSAQAWRLFDDVLPTLERLRRADVRLAVVSNWDSALPRLLEILELARYFEVIGVSALERSEKPDPKLFDVVLRRMNIEPGLALHVGDVPEFDLLGASNARVAARLIDREGRYPENDQAIASLAELPGIVGVAAGSD